MDIGSLIAPWIASMRELVPDVELFDAHTHLGQNDPDGMKQTPAELLEQLRVADARGCFVFPMHEPEGYPAANDMVIEAAAASGGLLHPFCRVRPSDGNAPEEARRAIEAGAQGIKLHPRAEEFTLDHPAIRELAAIVHERDMPMLVHAGRGIPALGAHMVALAQEFPRARFILAHAGITDLSWIWRAAAELPNLLFDTSWWMPADLQALFSLVPPGNVLFASDAPYGHTLMSAVFQLRSALQVGLSAEQIRCITSEQSLRIAACEPLVPAGPAVGERDRASHILLDRVAEFVMLGAIATMRQNPSGPEMLALAELACEVPDDIDDAPVFAVIRELLRVYSEFERAEPTNRRRLAFLILAASVARTPDVPLPALDDVVGAAFA